MKKLYITLVSVLFVTMFYSCSEDFLTKTPLGSTSENVFYDAKGIDALLTGAYGTIGGGNIGWGASIQNWTFGSAASDDAYKGSEITDQVPANDIERWEVQPTNNYPAEKYRQVIGYGADKVNKTLVILRKSEEDGTVTTAEATEFRAELRFLRALYYFEGRLV